MHRITTPKNPVVVETIVSGTSTPSSIGEVRPADEALLVEQVAAEVEAYDQAPRFVVGWVNSQGQDRWLGELAVGISPEAVVRLVELLVRHKLASTFQVTRVG